MVYMHAVVAAFRIYAQRGEMLLKQAVRDCALNIHGNYIVDHGKSWNCVFEFLWEPFFHISSGNGSDEPAQK